jgi:hypothetical protein
MVVMHGAEPDETSMGLYAEWLQMFPPKPSRPSDIYSMPESAAASPEEDCAFDYTDEQSCVEEHQDTMEEYHQEQTEAEDQTADTLGVAYDGTGTIPGDSLRDPRLMSKIFTECVDSPILQNISDEH